MLWKVIKLLVLVIVSIGINYFVPDIFTSLFFVILLLLYFRSQDEPFWLAYFLIVSDGFFGFFGQYEAMLTAIPGLPAIEVGQFYILLSIVKALRIKSTPPAFFTPYLQAMAIYIIFLFLQGYAIGISTTLQAQLRLIKLVLPLMLFFSIPRLLDTPQKYQELLTYLFPAAFAAFAAQIFTISTGQTPGQFFNVLEKAKIGQEVSKDTTYRGLYNSHIILLTFFGGLYFLIQKESNIPKWLLTLVVIANFLSVFLSATRGWVIGLSLTLLLYYTFIAKLSPRMVLGLVIGAVILMAGIMAIPVVRTQITNAQERMLTMESLAQGDLTAGGTLGRLNDRGPRVMKKWRESPLTGFGYSDEFFDYADHHVGNHTILLHGGIIGALIMGLFFAFFSARLYFLNQRLSAQNPYKGALLVFIAFLVGWFAIHSSSRQFFGFSLSVKAGMIMSVFFFFAAEAYRQAKSWEKKKEAEDKQAEPEQPPLLTAADYSFRE